MALVRFCYNYSTTRESNIAIINNNIGKTAPCRAMPFFTTGWNKKTKNLLSPSARNKHSNFGQKTAYLKKRSKKQKAKKPLCFTTDLRLQPGRRIMATFLQAL